MDQTRGHTIIHAHTHMFCDVARTLMLQDHGCAVDKPRAALHGEHASEGYYMCKQVRKYAHGHTRNTYRDAAFVLKGQGDTFFQH